jgi:hypothetical protein
MYRAMVGPAISSMESASGASGGAPLDEPVPRAPERLKYRTA